MKFGIGGLNQKALALVLFLLFLLVPQGRTATAQSTADCRYKETRKNIPINPKTKKPFKRNEEPFEKPSITKTQIELCLRERVAIKNHHIAFEDYREAWQTIARKRNDYTIPLKIDGGILFATKGEKLIRLWDFREPTIKDASALNDAQRKKLGIKDKNQSITLIRAGIGWANVRLGPSFSVGEKNILGIKSFREWNRDLERRKPIIFSGKKAFSFSRFPNQSDFIKATFGDSARFAGAMLGDKASFVRAKFGNEVSFDRATFGEWATFDEATFGNEARFDSAKFGDGASFRGAAFGNKARFIRAKFGNEATFFSANFGDWASFFSTKFGNEARFNSATFGDDAEFLSATFGNKANFLGATFGKKAGFTSTFGDNVIFSAATFGDGADFKGATFGHRARFFSTTFGKKASFEDVTIGDEASFFQATFGDNANMRIKEVKGSINFSAVRFEGNADFRKLTVRDTLRFDNSNWGGQADLRHVVVGNLIWDSENRPSDVKDTFYLRNATIGSANFKAVRFLDLADFSGAAFEHEVRLENNTFEKEADFLRSEFRGPIILIRNRFRGTLDLTGIKFLTNKAGLCLSYNRINRIVLEPEHLGIPFRPLGFLPRFGIIKSMYSPTYPLQLSKIQRVKGGNCAPLKAGRTASGKPDSAGEPLSEIYKTLENSFRDANDRTGANEAWYLRMVAEREKDATGFWPAIWARFEWFFLDLPSRYTTDVWRSVWISISWIFIFFAIYWVMFRKMEEEMKQVDSPARQRTFRFRPFESYLTIINRVHQTVNVKPAKHAFFLSMRSFLKIGIGTTYPRTKSLSWITGIEWCIGMYMLIHFILAIKNNLPFALPFLGAAG